MNFYVVKWSGMFFTGSAWNPEYPEAKLFASKRYAILIDGAAVIRNYGFDKQETVYPF
jgi:hypothetical protein